MLAALANAERTPATKGTSRRRRGRKAERPLHGCKVRMDHETNRIDWSHLNTSGERMAVLAPGELDDDIDDIFGHLPPAPPRPGAPFKAWNEDGTVYLGEKTLALAAKIKAERKAEAKAAAAEARKIRNAEKRAAGLPLRAPAKKKVLTGREIPSEIRGRVTVTGTINAKTGEALIIDVTFRNTTHSGIVVWAGDIQPLVTEAAKKNKALDLVIAQPANDRFRPSVRRAA